MVRALFDTNILIDYLKGVDAAKQELAKYNKKSISIITWMEILAGTDETETEIMKKWLLNFNIENIDSKIAEKAVIIRKKNRIRLPDAIIWATAQVNSMLLVSRNTKDFPKDEPGIRVPYTL